MAIHLFKRDHTFPGNFMASLQSYHKTYIPCTISLECIIAVKKTQNFRTSILKSHPKSSLRPFLHWALQLFGPTCTILGFNTVFLIFSCHALWEVDIFKFHEVSHLPWGECHDVKVDKRVNRFVCNILNIIHSSNSVLRSAGGEGGVGVYFF